MYRVIVISVQVLSKYMIFRYLDPEGLGPRNSESMPWLEFAGSSFRFVGQNPFGYQLLGGEFGVYGGFTQAPISIRKYLLSSRACQRLLLQTLMSWLTKRLRVIGYRA